MKLLPIAAFAVALLLISSIGATEEQDLTSWQIIATGNLSAHDLENDEGYYSVGEAFAFSFRYPNTPYHGKVKMIRGSGGQSWRTVEVAIRIVEP